MCLADFSMSEAYQSTEKDSESKKRRRPFF
jgi:hypothetical protein